MGARKIYEEQIMQLVYQTPEEKLPVILAHLKNEAQAVVKINRTKEEMLTAIEMTQGLLKGKLSSVDDFMKWKQEEKAMERW